MKENTLSYTTRICKTTFIVNVRLDKPCPDFLSPLRKGSYHFGLYLTRLSLNIVVIDLWHGELEHIGSLNIRNLTEHLHKLWQVIEFCKSRLSTVVRTLGNEFVKMIFASFLNSNIYPLKNLPTSRVCIFLETPYSKASSHFPIASH